MHKRSIVLFLNIATVLTCAAVLLLGGCDSKSKVDSDDSLLGADVSITASPASLGIGATAVVEFSIKKNGQGLANQVITFAVNPSDAGYFTPQVDTTDADGIAASVFTATSTGAVVLEAYTAGYQYPTTTNVTISETAQSGSGNIDISISPSLLLANGADTAEVTITVRDAVGQPAPDSTLVKIAGGEKFVDIDGNGYWSNGIDSLVFDANANGQWDAVGLIPSTAMTTGGDGTVTVYYVSGNNAQTAYVKATVDDNGINGTVEATVQITPSSSVDFIFLYSDSINLVVKQTGGIEVALLHAACFDVNGNPSPEGLPVSFIITDGPGGDEHLGTVGYGPYSTVTNSQGVATASIHSGTKSGTIRIRASSGEILSNATQVMVSSGPPAYLVVGAEDCNVDYWDNVAEFNAIVAVVSDVYLNPVNDSTVVYFTTDEGTMKSHEERTTKQEGIVTSKWISGNNVSDADGKVYVYAETAGGTVVDTSMFFNTHFPATITAVGVPGTMPADGKAKVYVWVTGVDLNGNPVIGGTSFRVDASYLGVAGGTFEDGCYSSSARVEITSKTLDMDYSLTGANDDGIGAVDVVTYWHPAGASTSHTVTVTTGMAYSGNSSISVLGSAVGGEVANFLVLIKDRFGNPLGDHTLSVTVPSGAPDPASMETNAYGEAYFSWLVPGAPGDYPITVTDTDPRGEGILSHTVTVEE